MTNNVSTFLKYANLQMAAESLFGITPSTTPGQVTGATSMTTQSLEDGNRRSSRFTDITAQQFLSDGWQVVQHKSNTTTGFSGTLFKNGTGELVISFRSTEFADDNVRDSKATNELEIKEFGWAFGQIDDMEKWYADLRQQGLIDRPVNVTGYSLGGHLATAFNLLRQEKGQLAQVANTYTFNGAGVGDLKTAGSLSYIIQQFDLQRQNASGNEIVFTDARVRALYNSLHSRLNGGTAPTNTDLVNAYNLVTDTQVDSEQAKLLYGALNRIKTILDEVAYVGSVTNSGGSGDPVRPAAAQMDATKLDYQLAALIAGRSTSAYRTNLVSAGIDGYFGRNPHSGLNPNTFFDIYGATTPSSVSNSQYHYGTATPVFIENQPLYRGNVRSDVADQFVKYGTNIKPLVTDFSQNDFGDTHSLVLLVDSLNVQNTLAQLFPGISNTTLNAVLQAASNLKEESVGGSQGKAEGDVMENVVNALADILGRNWTGDSRLKGDPTGGTWARLDDKDGYSGRTTFYQKLQDVVNSDAYKGLIGKATVLPATANDLASKAKTDFGIFTSLMALSPVVISTTDATAAAKLKQANQSVAQAWEADAQLTSEQRASGMETFTQQYLDDRANMVRWLVARNRQNGVFATTRTTLDDMHFNDVKSKLEFDAGRPNQGVDKRQTAFGGDAVDTLNGTTLDDHLYGGAGNDILNGFAGNDYVEGNADDDMLFGGDGDDALLGGKGKDFLYGGTGRDKLYGGEGDDELYGEDGDDGILDGGNGADRLDGGAGIDALRGGDGDDSLTGGTGDDRLEGGNGVDTYLFSGLNFGHDIIEDSDGKGVIRIDGANIAATAKKIAPGVYESADKKVRYEISGENLGIRIAGSDNTITIRKWTNGQLGITLDEAPVPVTPPTYAWTGQPDHNYQDNWQVATSDPYLLQGFEGNDLIAGGNGDDMIDGGGGDDLLLGGNGVDHILGGTGADWIFGSGRGGGMGTVTPPQGAPIITQGYQWYIYKNVDGDPRILGVDASSWTDKGNVLDGGAGADHIDGGDHNDVAHGGDDNDIIYGLAGDDLLFGDAGDDVVFGDGVIRPGTYEQVLGSYHGNDILDGGAGTDNLFGDGGDDEVYGGDGKDYLYGDQSTQNRLILPQQFDGNDYLDGGADDDWMEGGQRDDALYGGAGNDTMFGDGAKNNEAATFEGEDYLDGEDGDDKLVGGGSNDTLFGGVGKDQMWGDAAGSDNTNQGSDYLDGEDGDDDLIGGGNDDQLFGGDGNDHLFGDDVNVTVGVSLHGKDYLDGEAGDDELTGGGNDDQLFGGEGDDAMRGDDDIANVDGSAHGNDYLDGGAGNDSLQGDGGDDTLVGGDGNDFLAGEDQLNAGDPTTLTGNDVLYGGAGDDALIGGKGNDTLDGGSGLDYLDGGAGDDTYVIRAGDVPVVGNIVEGINDLEGSNTLLFASGGPSKVVAAASNGGLYLIFDDTHAVSLQNGLLSGFAWVDDGPGAVDFSSWLQDKLTTSVTVAATEAHQTVHGGGADDSLISIQLGTRFDGGWGNDFLTGSGGNNTYVIRPMGGVDTITDTSPKSVSAPNKVLFGEGIVAADLTLTQDGSLVVQVGSGGDAVRINGFAASNTSAFTAIDTFEFADASSLTYAQLIARGFDYAGTAGADTLTGTNVVDRFAASAGNDTLKGGTGSDIYAWGIGSGQDTIDDGVIGTASSDTLAITPGLTPLDVILSHVGNDLVVRTRTGTDKLIVVGHFVGYGIESMTFDGGPVWSAADIATHITNELTEGSDSYTGTANADFIDAKGGNDSVQGVAGNDIIDGGSGNDSLSGGDGNDTLLGNVGNDLLYGNAGNDWLSGGAGLDSLYGGDGSDTYVVSAGTGPYVYEYFDASPNVDALLMPAGSTASSVELFRWFNSSSGWYDDLVVRDNHSASTAYLTNYCTTQNSDYKVEEIHLGDGTVWSVQDVMAKDRDNQSTEAPDTILGHRWADVIDGLGGGDYIKAGPGDDVVRGGAGDDTLYGDDEFAPAWAWVEGNDTLDGGSGNDRLFGGGGSDTLDGGTGNDRLSGGLGNDTYLLGRAAGSDSIDDAGGTDRILMASGVLPTDVTLFRIGSTFIMAMDNGATQHSFGTDIESIQFANGTVWNAATIAANAITGAPNAMVGTAGDDTFVVDDWNDTISEGVNQGTDTVLSSVPYYLAANLENLTLTGYLNNSGQGNELDNAITGNSGDNFLQGLAGKDTLYGGGGNDKLYANDDVIKDDGQADSLVGGSGDDQYFRVASGDQVVELAGEGFDVINLTADGSTYTMPDNVENLTVAYTRYAAGITLTGNSLNNVITADPNTSGYVLDGGAGADTLIAGSLATTFIVDNPGDTIVRGGSSGYVDKVQSWIDWSLAANLENLELLGSAALRGVGNDLSNELRGNAANNVLEGLAGNDVLYGFAGVDTLMGGDGNDSLHGEYGGDRSIDTLVGGKGNDIYYTGPSGSVIQELANEGTDTVVLGDWATVYHYNYQLSSYANVENISLSSYSNNANVVGTSDNNTIVGNFYDNRLDGGAGNDLVYDSDSAGTDTDVLLGGDGNDSLISRGGADVLDGGAGDDLLSGSGNVTIAFGHGSGNDRWTASGAGPNRRVLFNADVHLEDMQLARAGADLQIRVGVSDVLTVANFFVDTVSTSTNGLLGSVQFADGAKLDQAALLTRLLNNNSNVVTQGDDVLLGSSGADTLSGLGGKDLILSGDGDDVLAGGTGDDTLQGGQGNDAYQFALGDGQDAITEVGGAGDAIVLAAGITTSDVKVTRSGADLLIAAGQGADRMTVRGFYNSAAEQIEALRFNDGTLWDSAKLMDLASTQLGTAGDDSLVGFASADRLYGLAGNDRLDGYAGNDLLDGGAGSDTMYGGFGDDTYVVDVATDVVGDLPNGGTDVVQSLVTWTLGADIENLTLTGTAPSNGTGNALANLLVGNIANNILNGGGLADTMIGGAGDDTYVVDVAGDVVTELAAEGTDTVSAVISWALGANVENLTLTGSALINGTGNALVNKITGNGAANRLDGGAGADTMIGGAGNDIYVVDNSGDQVTEIAAGGIDTVESSVSFTLAAELENLTLTGTAAIDATGNTVANTLRGNAGVNVLTGGLGNDTMIGGAGNDTYRVDSTLDVVTEALNEGVDTVESGVTWVLGANLENLTLTGTNVINGTGNTLVNRIVGNGAANRLDGSSGADVLIGGAGNDTYVVDNAADAITELANGGTDMVEASITWTLGAELENLLLTSTGNTNGTGNALANTLTGNVGLNRLDGGLGADRLVGGAGNDTYVVDNALDVVVEAVSAGTDTVESSLTWSLAATVDVENLTLTGSANNNATGNALANVLRGTIGSNTLDGAAGNDTMIGGAGADIYRFGSGYGVDTVQENDTTTGVKDALQFVGSVTQSNVQFKHVGNDLEVLLNGTSDKMVIQNWYLGSQYHVEEFRFTDSTVLLDSQVQGLVSAMASFNAPTMGIASASMQQPHSHMLAGQLTMPAFR